MTVLRDSMFQPEFNFPHPPLGAWASFFWHSLWWLSFIRNNSNHFHNWLRKYYLVNSTYSNTLEYFAPYIGQWICHHVPQFKKYGSLKGGKKQFNHRQPSLWMKIDRTFGVLNIGRHNASNGTGAIVWDNHCLLYSSQFYYFANKKHVISTGTQMWMSHLIFNYMMIITKFSWITLGMK